MGEIGSGDTVTVRTALNLTIGQTFVPTNVVTNLNGSFFNSPFSSRVDIDCTSNSQDISFSWVTTYIFFQEVPPGNLGSPWGIENLWHQYLQLTLKYLDFLILDIIVYFP